MKEIKSIYLTGKMLWSHLPIDNTSIIVSSQLTDKGYEVCNAARSTQTESFTWKDCLKIKLPYLVKADMVALLPNWEDCEKARLEVFIARSLCIPVVYTDSLLDDDRKH
jgi:hypothetical protein